MAALLFYLSIVTTGSYWTEWVGTESGGTEVNITGGPNSYINKVCAHAAEEVDKFNASLSDGTVFPYYGGSGGYPEGCYQTNDSVWFTAVKVEHAERIVSLQFTTSDGYQSPVYGAYDGTNSGQYGTISEFSGTTDGVKDCITKIGIQYYDILWQIRFYFEPPPTPSPTTNPTVNPTSNPIAYPTNNPTTKHVEAVILSFVDIQYLILSFIMAMFLSSIFSLTIFKSNSMNKTIHYTAIIGMFCFLLSYFMWFICILISNHNNKNKKHNGLYLTFTVMEYLCFSIGWFSLYLFMISKLYYTF
eukprot:172932_1